MKSNKEQLDPTVCSCSVCPFCICKYLSVPKPISGAGPHSQYNLLLTALIFCGHVYSTIAYFQMSSRAMDIAWTKCSLPADRETETYREHNLHIVPWGPRGREERPLCEPP